MTLSIVVPVWNEEGNIEPLVEAVRVALGDEIEWELLLVDDGSEDGTARLAAQQAERDPRVRLVRMARNYGQTAAMQAGLDRARGAVVVTMDGDLQNDPRDIPRLLEKLEEGNDLVCGYRERRKDRLLTRKVPSWVANRLIAGLTGVAIRDNGCSLKAYRRELVKRVRLYSDMHRFIPVVVSTAGGRIAEIPVRHHPRRSGSSKYGLSRIAKVLADLLTMKMIGSFRERPLSMFGLGALGSAALGVFFAVATAVAFAEFRAAKAAALVFPTTALLWFGLAFYLIMLGLIAEVALRTHKDKEEDEGGAGGLPIVRDLDPQPGADR